MQRARTEKTMSQHDQHPISKDSARCASATGSAASRVASNLKACDIISSRDVERVAKQIEREMKGVTIPENSVESVRLIIEEAAAVLKGHAERMHEMAAADDWKSKTAAMLTMDHVKKLARVHGLLTPPNVRMSDGGREA